MRHFWRASVGLAVLSFGLALVPSLQAQTEGEQTEDRSNQEQTAQSGQQSDHCPICAEIQQMQESGQADGRQAQPKQARQLARALYRAYLSGYVSGYREGAEDHAELAQRDRPRQQDRGAVVLVVPSDRISARARLRDQMRGQMQGDQFTRDRGRTQQARATAGPRGRVWKTTGEVLRTKRVDVRNQDVQHLVALVKVGEGRRRIVDLGPTRNFRDVQIQEGDRITVFGLPAQIADQRVLLAARVEKDDQVVNVRWRPRDAQQRRDGQQRERMQRRERDEQGQVQQARRDRSAPRRD